MYISIKLPPAFGSFNRLQRENYPFNNLFTTYLSAVSRLGISLGMDVDELVGYIEDRVFDGMRVPDVPEGESPVNIRYRTDDQDIINYIGGSSLTNRMAVMYIARMTLRLSAAYGTSLFRLTRLINDLAGTDAKPKEKKQPQPAAKLHPAPEPVRMKERAQGTSEAVPDDAEGEAPVPMPRVTRKAPARDPVPMPPTKPQVSSVSESARAAMEALNQLDELTAKAEGRTGKTERPEPDGQENGIVETSPFLQDFLD